MYLFGISIFGGIFVWIMILVTVLRFRKKRAAEGLPPSMLPMPGFPVLPVIGIVCLVLILLDAFLIGMSSAWIAGVPWLILLTVIFYANKDKFKKASDEALMAAEREQNERK